MLRRSRFALHTKLVLGQRGKLFFFFCIFVRFRAFQVEWDTLFIFLKIFVSAKRKTRASEASKLRVCWSDWLYQSFIKKKSFSSIILFFRNCVCCERLWPLRSSALVWSPKVRKFCLWCYFSEPKCSKGWVEYDDSCYSTAPSATFSSARVDYVSLDCILLLILLVIRKNSHLP